MRARITTIASLGCTLLSLTWGCNAGTGPTGDGSGTNGVGQNGSNGGQTGSSNGSGTNGTSGGDTSGTGTGTGMGTGAGTDAGSTTIYCGAADDTECVCSKTQSNMLSADGQCSASGEGSPSLCCAIAGWPNTGDDNGYGGCWCSKIFCHTDGDVCQCGFAKESAGETPVSSCSAGSGEICCRGKSNIAPTCSCFKGSQCVFDGDEQVPSCGPSTLACADNTVSSCR